MGWTLGIDLGTTFTAAAIWRDGTTEIVPLGDERAAIPSLVFLVEDDTVVVGETAEREGRRQPARLGRDFLRRFGDSIPVLLDRTPVPVENLVAVILRQVVAEVCVRMGDEPIAVAVVHPASWAEPKIGLLGHAIRLAGIRNATVVAEPLAAAAHYANVCDVKPAEVVVVYDLGGGSFEASVLRRTTDGFDVLGRPQGIEQLGGIDFDEAIFRFVHRAVPHAIDRLNTNDPSTRAAVATLRREFVAVKEALSSEVETTIHIELPTLTTQLRLSRVEFEDMIRGQVHETVETTERAIALSGVTTSEVSAVLLLGGSSRIPLVAETLRRELDIPIATELDPEITVALGAARIAAVGIAADEPVIRSRPLTAPPVVLTPPLAPPPLARLSPPEPSTPEESMHEESMHDDDTLPPPTAAPPDVPQPRREQPATAAAARVAVPATPTTMWRKPKVIGATVALLLVVALVVAVSAGDDDPGSSVTTETAVEPLPSNVAVPSSTPGGSVTTALGPADGITCGVSGHCVGISQIDYDGTQFTVHYAVWQVDPLVNGGPDDFHLHFFFDTVPVEQAGAPASGTWLDWGRDVDGDTYLFEGFTSENAADFGGAGATQICVAVADHQHVIEADTASCFDVGIRIEG